MNTVGNVRVKTSLKEAPDLTLTKTMGGTSLVALIMLPEFYRIKEKGIHEGHVSYPTLAGGTWIWR
jgi:hypothetical protein